MTTPYDYQTQLEIEMKQLGIAIKKLRKIHDISQKQCQVTAYVIADIENGTHIPRLDTLHKIASEFGMTLAELFEFSTKTKTVQF